MSDTPAAAPTAAPTLDEGRSIDDALRATLVEQLLGADFAGDLIGPDDAGYDAARSVWNAMIDKRPGLIARCTSTADVVAVVGAAREHGLAPSIRAGGHSVSGKALVDGGLTIDMTRMRGVEVDAERKLVHVQGGCLLGDVDTACAEHGLVVPAGIVSETGVPGLALGGGVGWFSRKHGLTCDNFHALELVLASGEVVEVTEETHPDLFWALRGGGGNFGVVTRFTFRAYEFGPNMRVGVTLYRAEHAKEALLEYARVFPTLPSIVGWHAALKAAMPKQPYVPDELVGERLVMMFSMWLGDAEDPEGIAMIERLNAIGHPCLQAMEVVHFAHDMQRALDAEFPDGKRNYTKEAHLTSLDEQVIDTLIAFWDDMPMDGEVAFVGLGGAIQDVPEDAAAFSNRHYQLWINMALHWEQAAHDADYMGRIRAVYEQLRPWIGTGVYVNMLNVDEMDRVVEAFGGPEKYAKLGRVKAQYDPHNLFRVNYNISPVHA